MLYSDTASTDLELLCETEMLLNSDVLLNLKKRLELPYFVTDDGCVTVSSRLTIKYIIRLYKFFIDW